MALAGCNGNRACTSWLHGLHPSHMHTHLSASASCMVFTLPLCTLTCWPLPAAPPAPAAWPPAGQPAPAPPAARPGARPPLPAAPGAGLAAPEPPEPAQLTLCVLQNACRGCSHDAGGSCLPPQDVGQSCLCHSPSLQHALSLSPSNIVVPLHVLNRRTIGAGRRYHACTDASLE